MSKKLKKMNVVTVDKYTLKLPVCYIINSTVLSMFLNRKKNNFNCSTKEMVITLPVSFLILKTSIEYFNLIYSMDNFIELQMNQDESDYENEPIDDSVENFHELVSSIDYNFIINLSFLTIFELFVFADYINFKQLKKLTSLKIAFEIKQCKTVEEIRNFFDVKNNFEESEYTRIVNESDCLHFCI
jgi:hypothetical protein